MHYNNKQIFSECRSLTKSDAEISANAYAFKTLADFYFDENTDRYSKLYDFMAYFGIPMSLESSVLKNI